MSPPKQPPNASETRNYIYFFLTLLLSGLFGTLYNPQNNFTKKDVMRALDGVSVSRSNFDPSRHTVALGFNANVDLVVDGVALLTAAGIEAPQGQRLQNTLKQRVIPEWQLPSDHADISGPAQLAECFKRFSSLSSAAERTITDPETFQALVDAAKTVDSASHEIGGNAALMGQRFVELGFPVILGGQAGPQLAELMAKDIEIVSKEPGVWQVGDQSVNIKHDEVHIILEYKKGTKWGGWGTAAERANRFIVSKDESNAAIVSLEPLMQRVRDASAKGVDVSLVVVSGVHLLDAHDDAFVGQRFSTIANELNSLDKNTKVHLELASIGRDSVMESVLEMALPRVDSVGLNEQELASLYTALGGKFDTANSDVPTSPDTLSKSVPPTQEVVHAIKHVFEKLKAQSRSVSRLHFHSLGYHIVALRKGAGRWQDARKAVAAGSIAASVKACRMATVNKFHGNQLDLLITSVTVDESTEVIDITPDNPVTEFTLKLSDGSEVEFYLAPVLVCKDPVQTVGLGDAISATALGYQL